MHSVARSEVVADVVAAGVDVDVVSTFLASIQAIASSTLPNSTNANPLEAPTLRIGKPTQKSS